MFKQKMEKIDFNYLTWHNMQRVYQKYRQASRASFNEQMDVNSFTIVEGDETFGSLMDDKRMTDKNGQSDKMQEEAAKF